MSSSGKKQALRAAREALAAKEYRAVLQTCKEVLKEDRGSYEAFAYIGKAAYCLGEVEQAELAYQRAVQINDKAAAAWQGLSELYHETQQWVKAADADQALVDLAHSSSDAALADKLPTFTRRLGAALVAAGQLEEAEVALRDVLAHPLPREEKLRVLAQLADVQLKEDRVETDTKVAAKLADKLKDAGGDASKVCEEAVRSAVLAELADEALELDCDHATPTLKDIVCFVGPLPSYVRFHDTYLRKLRQAVNVALPGSMDRHNRRVAVLEVCRAMMEGRCAASADVGQGCASPYAYETALRLLEIEEEIVGARMPRSSSQDFAAGLPRSSSQGFASGLGSPRSGLATPTAAQAAAAGSLLSPGPGSSYFGVSLLTAARVGSLGAFGAELPLREASRSGAVTPTEAAPGSGGAGLPPLGPGTPKRDMSSARLAELVHNPMAGAAAAAGGTMAAQERESFSQLAAEAGGGPAAGATANGTPGGGASGFITPVGSLGQVAPIASWSGGPPAGGFGLGGAGLSSLSLAPSALLSRCSSSDLTGASPRYGGSGMGTPGGMLTPKASAMPAAAPLLMADREVIARRLLHAFPWNPSGQVHLAMALRRREAYMDSKAATIRLQCAYQAGVTDLTCSALAHRLRAERPRQLARRAWLVNLLAKGLAAGAPVVSGMIGLAELRLEAGDATGALDAAKRGIKFVFDRNRIGKERARHAALMLNLLAAQALLAAGQPTDAGRIFVRLAGRVSDGEVGFGCEAVGLPAANIRQQAIRGLAQVALAQGDTCQALHHYGELVSKALMGRGSAEHWAYAEYGWLLFQEGNADAGRYQLETALDVLHRQTGLLGNEAIAAGYHYKLGRIYWALGGELKVERDYAHAQLLEAAAEEGPQQAEAFEWLGHWYVQVAADELRARKCFQRALALDPTLAGAGNALCDLLSARAAADAAAAAAAAADSSPAAAAAAAAEGQLALEEQLLQEMLLRAPDAQWARARLAGLQLQLRQYDAAVGSYQAAIRLSPKCPELWEGLGAAYQALGRHASALKSYARCLELEPARPYALMCAGALEYMAGAYEAAATRYRAALELTPQHPAALLGLAEVLLASACQHVAMGAAGAAAVELAEAAQRATAAVTGAKAGPAAGVDGGAAAGAAAAAGATPQAADAAPSAQAQEQAPAAGALQCSANLVTGWKLLGDIRLQQHLLQPAAAAAAAASAAGQAAGGANGAVAAALQRLSARQDLLRAARRAYAHALLLCPNSGELWGDVALCFGHAARLLAELQPAPRSAVAAATMGADIDARVAAARRAAVATARGGLRLAPASSWLWGVLGGAAAAAGDAAAAEYSYSRALALDPKAAMLWVQLGRLYSRYGAAELAEQCYEAARGAEPTLVPVWEGMAATAAASGSAAGATAAAAAAEHAVGLGGGPESWLEFATAGLRHHAPNQEGLLLACACKASAHQPLLLPPTAALAAALEARGQHALAVAALRYCLALLQVALRQGPQGLAALGLGDGASSHRLLLLQPGAGAAGLEPVASADSLFAALRLALARNLCLAGSHAEALALYEQLESSGALGSSAGAVDNWLCFGWAARHAGQPALCVRALQRAVEAAGDDAVHLRAVTALLQHELQQGSLEDAFSLLLQHLPQLVASSPQLAQPAAALWLAVATAAAAAGQAALQEQVLEVMRQCAEGQQQHIDMAWLASEQQCIAAAVQAAAGAKLAAARRLAAAVHACPWNGRARLRLADAALASNPRSVQAVYRACPVLLPEAVAQAGAGADALQQPAPLGAREVLAAASSRATALAGQVAAAVASVAGQEARRLQRLLHSLPSSPDLWYCLALATLLQAIGDGQAAHFRAARRCCMSALARVEQLMQAAQAAQAQAQQAQAQQEQAQQEQAPPPDGGVSLTACDVAQLRQVKVRLMVAVSECHQHSRLPGCHDAAHHWAMDALAVAMAPGGGGGSSAALAHRQVGRMLAAEGMAVEAEMAYRQAVTASGGLAAGAQLELAKLLAAQGPGRQHEAAALLHGIWAGAAEALAAAPARPVAPQQQGLGLDPGANFVEAAALEEALLLADLGRLDAARAAAAAGLRLAQAAGEAAPAAAELVSATVALQAASAAPADAQRNLLLEARWAASLAAKSGMALPGTSGAAAAGAGAAVLAQVELARGKPDKAYDAICMSLSAWVDQAVPAQLLLAAGELSGELPDCAAAVHTSPWLALAWQRLQLAAAAAGRPVLLP